MHFVLSNPDKPDRSLPPRKRSAKPRGFALVVTISLMVLLSLLAVGLLSLSTITLRSSTNATATSEARANARLALMVALGELQQAMGPDQRVSANGSILAESSGSSSVRNSRWMGVWESWKAGESEPSGKDDPSDHSTIDEMDRGMSPSYEPNREDHFHSWLVSLPAGKAEDIEAAKTLSFTPGKKPDQTHDAVTLVGEGSLGDQSRDEDHVHAPLVALKKDPTSENPEGRYAWWVGDESQKASILYDPSASNDSLALHEELFRNQAAAAMGHTVIDGLEDLDPDDETIARLPSRNTLGLVDGITDEGLEKFHDLTTSSFGVLADVREGGLKRDLSTILERTIDPSEVYRLSQRSEVEFEWATSRKPEADEFMLYSFDGKFDSDTGNPTNQASVPIQDLAAYYQTYDAYRPGWKGGVQFSSSDSSPPNNLLRNGVMVSNPNYGQTSSDYDRYLRQHSALYRNPVVVKLEMILSYVATPIVPAPRPTRQDPDPDTHRLQIGFSPAITLWNPFNVPLVMNSGDPDQHSLMIREHPINLRLKFSKSKSYDGRATQTREISLNQVSNTQQGELYTLFISGNSPVVFEPGEYKVFSVGYNSNSGENDNPYVDFALRGRVGNRFGEQFIPQLELKPGWNPAKFIIPENQVGGKRQLDNGGAPEDQESEIMLTIKRGDYVATTISNTGGNSFSTDFAQKSRHGRNAPGVMWHYRSFRIAGRMNRGNNGAPYKSDITHLGFPGSQGIASPAQRDIELPARRADELINATSGGINNAIPQPFLYHGMKMATETHESSVRASPAYGSARRFPSRPFLHSSASHPVIIDDTRGSSLYNYGWNWFFVPVDNIGDVPVEIAPGDHGYHGGGYTAESGVTHVVQQHLPLTPPISIASLSHAQLGGFSLATEAAAPGYWGLRDPWGRESFQRTTVHGFGGLAPHMQQAIGNSYAHPGIPADKAVSTWLRYYQHQGGSPPATEEPFADHSYLANKALWDEFYFSSISPKPDNAVFGRGSKSADQVAREFFFDEKPLPNRRLIPYLTNFTEDKLDGWLETRDDYLDGFADKIAAHLMVQGAFNVNSTSVDAWRALFSSLKGKKVSYLDPSSSLSGGVNLDDTDPEGVPVGAGPFQNGEAYTGSANDPSDPEQWLGWRELTDEEIDELAEAMVEQVKLRGPFLSLSEFVNRRLDRSDKELALKGALQAALDDPKVSINKGFRNGTRQFSAAETQYAGARFKEAAEGPIAYGSPAYVDQADILRSFAAQLTPRGDTFIIRTYGDSLDSSGEVQARAWCEATVQRVPDYLDPSDESHLKQSNLSSPSNQSFGRRLTITSFRWLNPSEI